jgi:Ca-activated chloride channel family protein
MELQTSTPLRKGLPAETFPSPVIRDNVDLTLVPATVTARDGRNISGLTAENFQLWEDKVEQKIEYLSAEDIPAAIGLVFDVSSSMNPKSLLAREAVSGFLHASNRDDEYFLVEFNSRPHLVEDFTTDIDRLEQRLFSTAPGGSTALFDAVHLALEKLRDAHRAKRVLMLISDGQDTDSRYGFRDIVKYVKEQDTPIYAIGTFVDRSSPARLQRRSGAETLTGLTDTTGGQVLFALSAQELVEICRNFAEELRTQYVIGYKSTNPAADGNWRRIRVKVNLPQGVSDAIVRTKSGYYALRARHGS